MALYSELPVYKDVYQLLLEVYDITRQFSREYKYSLGQDMKKDVLELMRSLYRANRSKEKEQFLLEFLEQYELLKIEIRLSYDLKILPLSRFANIGELMEKIGKQVVSWKKYATKNESI